MSKTWFGPRSESYWLRGWREISKPITEQGYAKPSIGLHLALH